jgi:2-dehydro-3-deoxyphosphooctonate aldolase (KDO 8-P synthase)
MTQHIFHKVIVGQDKGQSVTFWNPGPLVIMAGPCLLESAELAWEVADALHKACQPLALSWVFKASFTKANRTSLGPRSGMPFEEALSVFTDIQKTYGCPVMTDVHEAGQCAMLAPHVDILQIPAFLCRQTDLLAAAVATGKPLNIKKGQFLSPMEMLKVAEKVKNLGGRPPLLCERGACFGYNNLINDMRGLVTMASSGCPVVFDATHSVQKPGAQGGQSGGERWFVEALARAAVAVGVAGVFLETHPRPEEALSDGPNMVPLQDLPGLLKTLVCLDQATKAMVYQPFSQASFLKD